MKLIKRHLRPALSGAVSVFMYLPA